MRLLLFFSSLLCLVLIGCEKEGPGTTNELSKVSIEDLVVPEGDDENTILVKVTLDKASSTNVILRYSTKSGTAIASRDFRSLSDESLTMAPGSTEAFIPIKILGNTFSEPDKTFELILVNALNAELTKNNAVITLTNDDEETPGGLIIPDGGLESPETYPGYQLVWADEFKGEVLDTSNWTYEIGTGSNGWGNNERQYYKENNTFIHDNEYLVIEARREVFGGSQYTSSRIITSEKASFKYGRIDIRAALPKTQGLWPALWMLGDNFWDQGWPSCGEIDIMEMLGHQPNKVYGTAHWGPNTSQRQQKGRSIFSGSEGDFNERFHVFSIIWEEDKIEWYLNDQLYNTLTPADMNGFDYPFNNSFFFIFNIAVGGIWPGNPDETSIFPQHMIVDYVRVFQKN